MVPQKNWGLLATGIVLILYGIPVLIPQLNFGVVPAIGAIVAGVLLILNK